MFSVAGYVNSKKALDAWLRSEPSSINDFVAVALDKLPRTEALHHALKNGLVVEFTFDRAGTSKTGFVYRLIKPNMKIERR